MPLRCYKKLSFVSLLLTILSACSENEQTKAEDLAQNLKPTANSQTVQNNQPYKSMLVYPKKNLLPDFKLIDHRQQSFTLKNMQGKWSLLFLGYTNCPDVCPTMLTDITKIYSKIASSQQQNLQIIFLSVDPQRDSPEHLASYIDYFHHDFVAVTGEKTELDKLVAGLGGIYSLNTEEGEYYSVDHSSRLFLVDPLGRRYGIVTSEAMHNQDRSLLVKELEQMAQLKG